MEKLGIKELVEVLDLAEHVAVKAVEASRDGLGLDDLAKLVDPLLWAKGRAAFVGAEQVPAEAKDLDIAEIRVLADKVWGLVEKLVQASKKPAPLA
jgi:hypothetical protein